MIRISVILFTWQNEEILLSGQSELICWLLAPYQPNIFPVWEKSPSVWPTTLPNASVPTPQVANCWIPSLSKTPSHIYGSQLTHLLRCVRGFPRVFQSHEGAWGLSLSSGASPPNAAKTTIKNLAEEVSEQKGALMICFGSKSFYNFILPSQWPKWRWTQKGTLGNSRRENSLQERSPCAQVLVSIGDRFGLSGTQRVTEYLRSWEITETTLGRNCGPITQKLWAAAAVIISDSFPFIQK